MRLDRWPDIWRMRARSLFRRARIEDDLERELRLHLDLEAEERVGLGLPADDARAFALRRLGGFAQVQEECRDMRRVQYIEQLGQDFRYALRSLARTPGFTAVLVLTLALSIGANSAIFSVIQGVLLKPLPYPAADRLARIFYHNANFPKFPVNHFDLRDLRSTSRSFEGIAGYTHFDLQLSGVGDPVKLSGFRVTAGYFGVLGIQPAIGRDFGTSDELPANGRVAILSDRLWRSRFGADPSILGRQLLLDTLPFTVVAVMPPGTDHPGNSYNPVTYGETVDLWTPFTFEGNPARRGSHYVEAIGRLRPGVTPQQAEAELTALLGKLGEQYPATRNWKALVVPLYREVVGPSQRLLLVLLGAVGMVLLIACANAANLLLARATARQREIAVRAALGAARGRLVRQMLTESLALAVAGGVLGAAVGMGGTKALVAMLPANFPRVASIQLNATVFAFTFLIAIGTGVLFGLAPALQAGRFDVQHGLREGGRGATAGGKQNRLRALLAASEIALACVLLIGAGLMLRSFVNLLRSDPGFHSSRVLTATLTLPRQRYDGEPSVIRFYDQLLTSLRAAPGVQMASAGTDLPWTGYDDNAGFRREGLPRDADDSSHARYHVAAVDYFRALGIPLLRGRSFTEADRQGAARVVLINDAMARRYWPGEDPVGRRIDFGISDGSSPAWFTIVGVVGDVKDRPASPAAEPAFWWPALQMPWPFYKMSVVLRPTGDPAALATGLRAAVRRLDSSLAISDVRLMDEIAGESFSTSRFTLFLISLFAGLALALAATGIYGVISYAVNQRMHEFGMRMALGARRRDVLSLVLSQALRLAAAGAFAGLAGAALTARFLASLLYGVRGIDLPTFASVGAVAIGVAALAAYVPARRATSADPMTALRAE